MSSHEEAGYAKKRPISTHKAFAPIVALWFAALLGLGSFVLPVAQIERLVMLTGIAKYLSVIAPPLDLIGRAIVAVVLALLGGAIGQVIARRLGAAHSGYATEETDGETRAPVSAHEELGDTAIEEEAAPRRSRRLAVQDDTQEEQVIEFAPLPMAMMPEAEEEEDEGAEEISFEPEAEDDGDPEPVEEEAIEEELVMDLDEASEPVIVAVEPEPEPEPEPEAEYEEAPLAVEPVAEVAVTDAPQDGVAPAVSPFEGRPLEELGLVQLVERLGASMQKRRAMPAPAVEAPSSTPAPPPAAAPLPAQTGFRGRIKANASEANEVEAFEIETLESEPEAEPAIERVAPVEEIAIEPSTFDAPAAEAEAGPEAAVITAEDVIETEAEAAAEDVMADDREVETATATHVEGEVEAEGEEIVGEVEPEAEPEPVQPDEQIEAEDEVTAEEDAADEAEAQVELANPFAQFATLGEDGDEEDEELASLEDSFRLPIGTSSVTEDEAEEATEEDGSPDDAAPYDYREDVRENEEDYDEEEDGEGDDEVYGSLLSLRRPFPLAPFGEVENSDEAEPVEPEVEADQDMVSQPPAEQAEEAQDQVATPLAATARDIDTEAHQRALRDALLSLQQLDRAG